MQRLRVGGRDIFLGCRVEKLASPFRLFHALDAVKRGIHSLVLTIPVNTQGVSPTYEIERKHGKTHLGEEPQA